MNIICGQWDNLLVFIGILLRTVFIVMIVMAMMRRTMTPMFRTGNRNYLLDDVYKLSILEYLLDVHLGADMFLGMLVVVSVVSRGGGGGGLHNNSSNNSNSNDEQGLHHVGGRDEVGRFVVVVVYFVKAGR